MHALPARQKAVEGAIKVHNSVPVISKITPHTAFHSSGVGLTTKGPSAIFIEVIVYSQELRYRLPWDGKGIESSWTKINICDFLSKNFEANRRSNTL